MAIYTVIARKSRYNKSIFKAVSGRMAIYTVIARKSRYNKSIFKAVSGRMAIYTVIARKSRYNVVTKGTECSRSASAQCPRTP